MPSLFRALDGKRVESQSAIFAICRSDQHGNVVEPLGTAFFVGSGIFLTADHVVGPYERQILMALVPVGNDAMLAFRIAQIAAREKADIALGRLDVRSIDGRQLPGTTQSLAINLTRLPLHSGVHTHAFPNHLVKELESAPPVLQHVRYFPAWAGGWVSAHYPDGGAQWLKPENPCFAITTHIDGGLSGGPVMSSLGLVSGVNSGGRDDVTFCTYIDEAMGLEISVPRGDDSFVTRSLNELVAGGEVAAIEPTTEPLIDPTHPAVVVYEAPDEDE